MTFNRMMLGKLLNEFLNQNSEATVFDLLGRELEIESVQSNSWVILKLNQKVAKLLVR